MSMSGRTQDRMRLLRAEVRNASVLELMLIIIFIALLMLGGAMTQLTEYQGQVDELELEGQTADSLGKQLAGARSRIINLLSEVTQLKAQVALLEDKENDLGSTLVALDRIKDEFNNRTDSPRVETLEELEAEVTSLLTNLEKATRMLDGDDDLAAQIQKMTQEADRQRERLQAMNDAVSQLAERLDVPLDAPLDEVLRKVDASVGALDSQLTTATNRVAEMEQAERDRQARVRGYVPCWEDEQGNREFIYNVTITNNQWRVSAGWPEDRRSDIRANPILQLPDDQSMTFEQWKSFANPIFEYGRAQPSNCRFIVRLFDRTTTKAAYQRGLRWVGRYFIYDVQ